MEDSKIEIFDEKMSITDEHFINKLNNSLNIIRRERDSFQRSSFMFDQNEVKLIPSISLDNIDFLYSNSPIMSGSNSDEENDCFDEMNEYSPKETFKKLTYQNVKCSLDKYYENDDKYSDEIDLLISYLNGQKNIYIQAKQLTQLKLNFLIFPCIVGSSAISFFAPFIREYNWSGVFIASINAMIAVCVSVIHYLKLESSIDSYLQLIGHYDKMENSLQMMTSKLFFLEEKREKSEIVLKKIDEFEVKMKDIKETITVLIPGELKLVFPIIYHIHIFSFIKRIETYKRNLIIKFKNVKNEIRYIVWKYGDSEMNTRVKTRLEFISGVKMKLKEELLYYKNAYSIMEELFIREIKQSENIGLSKYFIRKKKPELVGLNPVIDQYLSSIFIE